MESKIENCLSSENEKYLLRTILRQESKVFISGPMTGYENFNRAEFARIEAMIRKEIGCEVFNPGNLPDGYDYEWYMDRCAEDIRKCNVILFHGNWQKSPGALREYILASRLGKNMICLTRVPFDDLKTFQKVFNYAAWFAFNTAIEYGWHNEEHADETFFALMHSELSEALQALRDGNPPDSHCPGFSSLEIKLADVVIRIMDYAALRGVDIGGAVIAKMKYNTIHSFLHGGKKP